MVRLQHERNRAPEIVLVDGTVYPLDDQGVVEVSEEDAKALLQGAKWRPDGHWGARQQAELVTPKALGPAGRRARTREEMLALADGAGIEVPAPVVEVPEVPEPEVPEAEAESGDVEVIEVDESMTKAQLLAAARAADIRANHNMSKKELLALFDDAAEE